MSIYKEFLEDLNNHIINNKVYQKESLKVLRGRVLCLSSAFFIKTFILKKSFDCININVTEDIGKQLENVKEAFDSSNITLQVIFDGIGIFKNEVSMEVISKIWKQTLNQKELPPITLSLFQQFVDDAILIKILKDLNIQYFVAPYHSYNQMRWLFLNNFINGIAVDVDFFSLSGSHLAPALANSAFKELQIITDIDLKEKCFSFIDSRRLLSYLEGKPETLPDLFFSAGFFAPVPQLERAKDAFENFKNGLRPEQLKSFEAARRRLESIPVLTSKCEIEAHPGAKSLTEIQELLGCCLPQEVYILQGLGLVSRELIHLLAKNSLEIKIPPGDSIELRILYRKYFFNVYQGVLHLLLSSIPKNMNSPRKFFLEPYFKFQENEFNIEEIVLKGPFISEEQIIINSTEVLNFKTALAILGNIVRDSRGSRTRIDSADSFLLKTTSSSDEIAKGSLKSVSELALEKLTEKELHLHLMLCFLDFLKYWKRSSLSFNFHGLLLRKADIKFDEEILILLEMMRTEASVIFKEAFVRKEGGVDGFTNEDHDLKSLIGMVNLLDKPKSAEDKNPLIICISRVFGLISSSKPYNFLKNYNEFESSQYISILQATSRLLRHAYEAHIFAVFFNVAPTNNRVLKMLVELKQKHAPFHKHFNNELGLAVRLLLQGKLNITDPEDKAAFQKDFKKGLELWKNFQQIISYEKNEMVANKKLKTLFSDANQYLLKISDSSSLLRE